MSKEKKSTESEKNCSSNDYRKDNKNENNKIYKKSTQQTIHSKKIPKLF